MSTIYVSPLNPEDERVLGKSRPGFGRVGMKVPAKVQEAAQAFRAGRITKAEADKRVAGVNREIRARGIPQETRGTSSAKAAPIDQRKKKALAGARARVKKFKA